MKLLVASPMYDGKVVREYKNTLFELASCFMFERADIDSDCYIERARENCALQMMAGDWTHMLFFDADMGFDAGDVMEMLRWANKPGYEIIGAGYPKKYFNWDKVRRAARDGAAADKLQYVGLDWAFKDVGQEGYQLDKPAEATFVPTGVMVISRKVFETLPRPWFDCYWDKDMEFIGEDVNLCAKWRAAGNKVWVAPWVRTEHVGRVTFRGDMGKLND